MLPEGGSVAQRADAVPGKRKSVATTDEAASGDEDELWNTIFPSHACSGLEYEELLLAGLRGIGPPLYCSSGGFVGTKLNVRDLAFKLAAGAVSQSPFSDEMLEEGRGIIWQELRAAGCQLPVEERTPGQPFFLAAIEELLRSRLCSLLHGPRLFC